METMPTWRDFEPHLAKQMTDFIESHPDVLLEQDGGPWSLKADIILATLYGMDGQLDALWRIQRAEPTLLMPVMRSPSLREDDPMTPSMLNVKRYELQSAWATMELDWLAHRHMLPSDVKPAPGTYLVTAALLRYRHRI